jgi:paraquat-inducible protein B
VGCRRGKERRGEAASRYRTGDGVSDNPPPEAHVSTGRHRRWRFSMVWIIPIVTVAIGAWLAWHTLSQRGPTITITFQTAEGLQAGQSHVKHKDVDMGTVTGIALTKDLSRVDVTVEMKANAEPLLNSNAQFWVVKPRFFAGSISGLDTLLSGSYIELSPSGPGGEPRREFVGLEDPPVLQSDTPGTNFLLRAPRIGSITLGSPLFFRDMQVGEVLGWDIGDMAQNVTVHAFVRQPFDRYVHNNSRFWNASGLSIKLGGAGVQVQLESLKALLLGGIAFDTPEAHGQKPGDAKQSADGHEFPLYASKDDADSAAFGRKVPLVSYFNGSVAGLQAGADVTLHGLKIGTITGVGLQYDKASDSVIVPVRYTVEPERIADAPMVSLDDIGGLMSELVKRGLRAKLESASLITGQQQVALDFVRDAPPATTGMAGDAFIVPVVSAGSADIMSSASAIMAKLQAFPFEAIGKDLDTTLKGASDIVNGQQLKDAIAALQDTLVTAQRAVKQLDAGLEPTMKKLPEITTSLQETLNKANRLVGSLDTGYGGGSDFHRTLERMLDQLDDTARSIRVLADLLSRHPEALIRGRTDQGQE